MAPAPSATRAEAAPARHDLNRAVLRSETRLRTLVAADATLELALATELVPLRAQLIEMVKRPVNLQASRDIVLSFRGDLLGQPYLTLFSKPEGTLLTEPALPT